MIDGNALATTIFHFHLNRGLSSGFNPSTLYKYTKKVIYTLRRYKLKVIRVYFDALSNPEKLSTYLSRRSESQNSAKKFWDNGLTNKGRITISLVL